MATRGRTFEPTEKQRGQVEAMHAYGIPEQAIADKLDISRMTLRKHFAPELKTGATTANSVVGEFLFATISGKNEFKASPYRVAAAIFWAKTRMGWKETAVIEHKDGDLDEDALRERINRKITRLVGSKAARVISEEAE